MGLLYSAFTYHCGFKVNSGEYKLMGLAPYGDAGASQRREFVQIIKEKLVDIRDDGSILLNMDYFQFATGLRMTNDKKWAKLFDIPPRKPEEELTSDHMNLALAIQLFWSIRVLMSGVNPLFAVLKTHSAASSELT